MYRFLLSLLLFFFSFSALGTVFAEGAYTLVGKKEYDEWYEKPVFLPDARISGEYHIYLLNN